MNLTDDSARRIAAEERLGRPLPEDLTTGERADYVSVMTEDERSALLSFIAGWAPEVFDAALATHAPEFTDDLAGRVEDRDEAEYLSEPDGYCTVCGENVAWFVGHDGPQHFRGPHKLVTGAERRDLFTPDDGHAPAVAWRYPDTGSEPAPSGDDGTRGERQGDDVTAARAVLRQVKEKLDNIGTDLCDLTEALAGPHGRVRDLAAELSSEGNSDAGRTAHAVTETEPLTPAAPDCECGHPSDGHTTASPDVEGFRGGRMCDRQDCYCLGYRPAVTR